MGFFQRLKEKKAEQNRVRRMNEIITQALQMQDPKSNVANIVQRPSKSEELALDAWRFMVSRHPTIPTIDNK
jgi:hypothetical protein